jgi:C-terminal processing protease CtpA/Prc
LLSRFTIVLDYAHKLLILEPNSSFTDPYLYDASGLDLRLTPDGKHFRIHAIVTKSAAAEAGLRGDDLITAIDGRPADQLDLTDVEQHLLTQAGKSIRLDVQRGEQRFQVVVILRKLL